MFRIKRVQSISVTIKNNWLVGRIDLLVHFSKYNLKTAISTIGPSEKKYCRCTLSLHFFSSDHRPLKATKKERFWFLSLYLRFFATVSIIAEILATTFMKNIILIFFFMTLHCSILDRLTMIIILMIGIIYNSCNDLWHFVILKGAWF